MIRVVLVDDQELFRSGVAVVLDAQPDIQIVGEAGDGAEGVEVVDRAQPDVVLMDLRMPVLDGVQATREILRRRAASADPTTPRVIVLTTFDLDEKAAETIRLGASGFLLKDATPELLCATVRSVHAGTEVMAPGKLTALLDLIGPAAEPVPPRFATLSEREREVFRAASLGLSNAEIAHAVFLSESTVKTHVSSVLAKLDLRDRVQIVVFAHRHRLVD